VRNKLKYYLLAGVHTVLFRMPFIGSVSFHHLLAERQDILIIGNPLGQGHMQFVCHGPLHWSLLFLAASSHHLFLLSPSMPFIKHLIFRLHPFQTSCLLVPELRYFKSGNSEIISSPYYSTWPGAIPIHVTPQRASDYFKQHPHQATSPVFS